MGFREMYTRWAGKNTNKKLGDAIANGNERQLREYLKRKPEQFQYVLWGNNVDAGGDKTPIQAFSNPIALAQYVGRPEFVKILEQAGYLNPKAPNQPQNTTFQR